jgi:hypothetical protein
MRLRPTLLLAAMLAACAPWAAVAQKAVIVEVDPLACLPEAENAVVTATVLPDDPTFEIRLYFQRDQFGDLYYLVMRPLGAGRYWMVLPKPEKQNDIAEYHVTVVAADRAVLQSSPHVQVPVSDDCEVELTEEQREQAEQLRVGETANDQKGRAVAWWLCDGIIERIDPQGGVRPDEFCGVPPAPVPIIVEGDKSTAPDPEPPEEVSPSQL